MVKPFSILKECAHEQKTSGAYPGAAVPADAAVGRPSRLRRPAEPQMHPGLEGLLQLPLPPHRQQLQNRRGPEEGRHRRHLLDQRCARGHRLLGMDDPPGRVPLHLLRREPPAHQHQRPLPGGGPGVPDRARGRPGHHHGGGPALRQQRLPAHGVARVRRRPRSRDHPPVGDGARQVRHHAGLRPFRRRAGHDGGHHPHLRRRTGAPGPGGLLLRARAESPWGSSQRPLVQRHADAARVLHHRAGEQLPLCREDHPGDPPLQARGGHHPRHQRRIRQPGPPAGQQKLPRGCGGRRQRREVPQIRRGIRHLAGEEVLHPPV